MRSDNYLWNICMNIYRQLYKEASPSADFDVLLESSVTSNEDWFMDYTLNGDRIAEVLDFWCKKHKCSKHERRVISETIYLGSCPKSV